MLSSVADLAQLEDTDWTFLPYGPRIKIKQALLREKSILGLSEPAKILVQGAEISLPMLQQNLVSHHLTNWPLRDFRLLRSRSLLNKDFSCFSEQFNSSLKNLTCSFFLTFRPSKQDPTLEVITDLCPEHSCESHITQLHRNGRRKSAVRSSLAVSFAVFETKNQPTVQPAVLKRKLSQLSSPTSTSPTVSTIGGHFLPTQALYISNHSVRRVLKRAQEKSWKGHPIKCYRVE